MEISDLLRELYGRIAPLARDAVDGLDADALNARPAPTANHIGWLVWHLTRVLDHQVGEVSGNSQVWIDGDHAARLGLDADPDDIGYGHTSEQVAAVRPQSPADLIPYLDAVDARTAEYLGSLTGADLDRVVDTSYDPPVTLGVRLVSVADDCLQHAGQAAYVRGLLGR
ncbi:mycothiol transferase [Sporichthya polymorpha]|uniref:mycothiol transferase n=1 Tax=Sporichthya polymorpha TaxID=35751 RepID=UPI00036B8D56|nr:DinB family protein [Sporichthya polymorpha]